MHLVIELQAAAVEPLVTRIVAKCTLVDSRRGTGIGNVAGEYCELGMIALLPRNIGSDPQLGGSPGRHVGRARRTPAIGKRRERASGPVLLVACRARRHGGVLRVVIGRMMTSTARLVGNCVMGIIEREQSSRSLPMAIVTFLARSAEGRMGTGNRGGVEHPLTLPGVQSAGQ